MNGKEIRSFSLSQLLKVCGQRPEDLFYDGCLIASDLNVNHEIGRDLFLYPVRINAYAIVICSKGSINITSNLNHYTLREHMIYINLPGAILQVEASNDAEIFVTACEEEFINRIHVDLKLLTRLFLQVEQNPLLPLKHEDWQSLMRSYREIEWEGAQSDVDMYSTEVIRTAIRMLIYKVCRIIDRHLKTQTLVEQMGSSRNRNEEYFHRFMRLLAQNYMKERAVGFYASKMNLTPKYLTTIIRQTSGRTAISWIDDYVILEAKNLLKYSTMSIQEISYCLNFSNQSFFGKYFKNHTGITPSQYRLSK